MTIYSELGTLYGVNTKKKYNTIFIQYVFSLATVFEYKFLRQWSYGSWIYNYLCNQCLSPLMLWFESRSWWGVQHYVIKFVSDLRQVDGFLRALQVSSTNKTDCHDITEILLKVTLNTIKQTNKQTIKQ